MIEQVAVIGDGQMATVCGVMLADRGIHVRMWGRSREHIEALRVTRENRRYLPGLRIPDRVSFTNDPEAAFAGAELVLSAVPCQYMRGVWEQLGKFIPPGVAIASVAKGIENETLMRPSQIVRDVVGDVPVVALSGPSIAAELANCLPATVVAASEEREVARLVQQTFASQWFRVYTNTDLVGVELAGAMKNVIALAAGIVDGLKAGDNAKAALLTRGLVEIQRLGVAMGARAETFAGLAGMGDLVTTCISPVGRNRMAGEQIGRGRRPEEVIEGTPSVIEGIPTTRSVMVLAQRHRVEMPITEAVHGVLFEGKEVIATLSELMARQLKDED
ncbi:MAG TPA: NAD(P)H-dependent glycerol-3-phosphate dehydrogenase [Phycisphaerae bacterium]|nr:NAD(P)H-dependent glycerol-3-phosphate dehydrogenase [Phycisphaerae bacterium]